MSIATKFLRLIWKGWRARTRQIFYMCSRNVLKYSDFIFYVATTKNNKFNVNFLFCNKYRPISEACRRTRAGCAPQMLWKILAKIIYLKVCKFSFAQKHTSSPLKSPVNIFPKCVATCLFDIIYICYGYNLQMPTFPMHFSFFLRTKNLTPWPCFIFWSSGENPRP